MGVGGWFITGAGPTGPWRLRGQMWAYSPWSRGGRYPFPCLAQVNGALLPPGGEQGGQWTQLESQTLCLHFLLVKLAYLLSTGPSPHLVLT